MSLFEIKEPKSTIDFDSYFYFRWKILRRPYGQPLGTEKDDHEKSSYHLMSVDSLNEIVGVGRIHIFNDELIKKNAQIRYMAVLENNRFNGIGTEILKQLEKHAFSNKVNNIILNSRENAIDFYKKNGYEVIKKTHILYDSIQHWMMSKSNNTYLK